MIEVRRTGEGDPLKFEVVVREGQGETRHHVTMTRDTCQRLTAGKHTPERRVEAVSPIPYSTGNPKSHSSAASQIEMKPPRPHAVAWCR
jgi:hypothetical protein